jgi:hypothetical protein
MQRSTMDLVLGANVVNVAGGPNAARLPATARSWSEGVAVHQAIGGLALDLHRRPSRAPNRQLRTGAPPLAAESVSEVDKVEGASARQAVQLPAVVVILGWESDLFPIPFRRVGIGGEIAAIGAA